MKLIIRAESLYNGVSQGTQLFKVEIDFKFIMGDSQKILDKILENQKYDGWKFKYISHEFLISEIIEVKYDKYLTSLKDTIQ